jgi:hypothetical protein
VRVVAGAAATIALVGGLSVVGVMRLTQSGPAASEPVVPAGITATVPATPSATPAGKTWHYISNTGSQTAAAARIGFDLFDLGPDKDLIDALGPGQRALVWVGNLDNTVCTPGYSWSSFTAAVDRLAHDPKVFGYYLSDEPHPSICAHAARDIRARADYIRTHAPGQMSFIVVMDAARICGSHPGCEYRELNPASTHVDLYGIDPFPCHIDADCEPERIDEEVLRAVDAGIPRSRIIPVYQVFGQACSTKATTFYRVPTAAELTEMFAHWHSVVPAPAFDFAYTWRSVGPACPSLDRSAGLRAVVRSHNTG